jgi:hypothetical protein
MAWTIPDKGEGDNDIQSILFQEYLEVLVEGVQGINCVLSGLVVTGGADMTPAVAKGSVLSNGVMFAVAAADVTITAANATNPRIDLIVVTSAGALAVRAGTAAAAPKPPTRTTNDIVIAYVYVPANDTAIATTQIKDMRVIRDRDITIYKTTAAETTNTTAAAIHALNKANSGVTIPNGLFLTGKILRVKLGGNLLLNSGTPTTTVVVSYGGTTFFSDITAAAAADADRRAWNIEFVMVAQANNDQATVGQINIQVQAAAVTAPTTGIAGEIGGTTGATASIISPFQGAAGTIDSDAADRLLAVTFTFSVSNVANELVVEYATVELL